jgi:predicted  nucleic acid-binding Zn-ribbon protein
MPETKDLLALQGIDSTIDRLTARKQALESGAELVQARAAADAAEGQLGELRLSLDELGRDQSRLEHEIDSLTQKAQAEEHRLYDGSVANAKELASIQHEVENLRRRRAGREDELLALMERREELDAEAGRAEQTSTELRDRADGVAGATASGLSDVETELESRRVERGHVASTIDQEVLELYDDLRRQKKGVGAAALVDGVCQGCHEQLSSVELDRLKRTDGIRRCEHCRRILVF